MGGCRQPHSPAELGRLRWRSRRGMAEVELQLIPFLERRFRHLSPRDQESYARLLEADDWQIQDWLQGRGEPSEPALARIVSLIRRFESV